jgi:hypothetical protein
MTKPLMFDKGDACIRVAGDDWSYTDMIAVATTKEEGAHADGMWPNVLNARWMRLI